MREMKRLAKALIIVLCDAATLTATAAVLDTKYWGAVLFGGIFLTFKTWEVLYE